MRHAMVATIALLAGLHSVGAWAQATAPLDKAAVERIIKDYLLREPEVIYQALEELQQRRELEQASRERELVVAKKEAIFADAADPVLGNPDGDVTLVEFFDYRCGYCRNMVPGMRALLEKDKKLKLVMKEFPILGPDSLVATRAALAARRQGRYTEMHFALYQAKDLSETGVVQVAKGLGLDTAKLQKDMQHGDIEKEIAKTRALATELGITGTPSFVIADNLLPGAVPVGRLVELVAAERAKRK